MSWPSNSLYFCSWNCNENAK